MFFSGIFCLVFLFSCSTSRNTPFTRAYHQLVARYNLFFNAQQAYDEILRNQTERFQDDYSKMLPLFPFVRLTEKTQRGGAFDTVVERTERAIYTHSISSESGNEYNPFMRNVWLLLGRAHVQNQDYDDALAVFSYVVHLFRDDADVVAEAKLWTMRAYIETGRFCEAERLANFLKESELPTNLKALFVKNYAYLFLEKREYPQAIPFLQKTIEFQRNTIQRRRLQFLLGQTFATIGDNAAAFRAFESVRGIRTPHELSLNAIIQQSAVASELQKPQMLSELHRLSRRANNRDFLDKIHFAIGNIYFRKNDTTSAIRHYVLAENTQNANSRKRALAQMALADIFFDKKDFIQAEPRYSEALAFLSATDEAYLRVSFRVDVLRTLVPHLLAVQEQDSLQQLAKLSQAEQERMINRHIAERRERERDAEREAHVANLFLPTQHFVGQPLMTTESSFYFFNPQIVAQGRSEFQRLWGNRPLEDNWRTRNRQTILSYEQADGFPSAVQTRFFEPHSLEFYLQQLPTTPEMLVKSNRIIAQNLYAIGRIAKFMLFDDDFANQTFQRLLNDFSDSEYAERVRTILDN